MPDVRERMGQVNVQAYLEEWVRVVRCAYRQPVARFLGMPRRFEVKRMMLTSLILSFYLLDRQSHFEIMFKLSSPGVPQTHDHEWLYALQWRQWRHVCFASLDKSCSSRSRCRARASTYSYYSAFIKYWYKGGSVQLLLSERDVSLYASPNHWRAVSLNCSLFSNFEYGMSWEITGWNLLVLCQSWPMNIAQEIRWAIIECSADLGYLHSNETFCEALLAVFWLIAFFLRKMDWSEKNSERVVHEYKIRNHVEMKPKLNQNRQLLRFVQC